MGGGTDGNGASPYGVTVQRATPDAAGYVWRVESVVHVPDDRNANRHNVYVNAVDENGSDARYDGRLRLRQDWLGRGADEAAPAVAFDKPAGEWGANVPIFAGQQLAVWVEGDGIPSDVVRGMNTNHPPEGAGVGTGYGHHSYEVVYRKERVQVMPPAPPPPPPPVAPPVQPGQPGQPDAANLLLVVRQMREMAVMLNNAAINLDHLADWLDTNDVTDAGKALG